MYRFNALAAVPAALPLTVRRLCRLEEEIKKKKVLIKKSNVEVCTGCIRFMFVRTCCLLCMS